MSLSWLIVVAKRRVESLVAVEFAKDEQAKRRSERKRSREGSLGEAMTFWTPLEAAVLRLISPFISCCQPKFSLLLLFMSSLLSLKPSSANEVLA